MADLREQLDEALVGRYHVDRELGRGGMATVFLAHDVKHDRKVALKVLHRELAAPLGPERFQREIRTTARLQHPHILPVLDSGEAAGQLWYTMPFVEGESLRDRLVRERQLPLQDAVHIAHEVADALGYAHGQGVVHRDIKPENIMLTGGHALVADFGIARAVQATGGNQLTETGMSVGTPAYMSPEQSLADPGLDARSDIYSLGCVLYEMLAGEAPYTGTSAQAIVAKRLHEPVPHVRSVRETIPLGLDQALERALAKMPADRFATAAAFAQALHSAGQGLSAGTVVSEARRPARRPLAVALVGLGATVLVAVGAFLWVRTTNRVSVAAVEADGSNRLAVIPFDNLGDSADAYFADGLAGELRGRLAAVPHLQVIGTASSNTYRQSAKRPAEMAQELGVRYVLVGQVQWDRRAPGGGRLRVRPELVDGRTGLTTWGEAFDGTTADLFQVQADIANRVATALGVTLTTSGSETLAREKTTTPEAFDAYLRAKAALDEASTTAAWGRSRQIRESAHEALARDSGFAPAWALLSAAYGFECGGETNCPTGDSAKSAAERAIQLAPHLPDGYRALSRFYSVIASDPTRSLKAAEDGLREVPNDPDLLGTAAWELGTLGEWEKALKMAVRAEALDPRSAVALHTHARLLAYLRRFDELGPLCRRGLAVDPRNVHFVAWQMIASLAKGDSVGARVAFEQGSPSLDLTTLTTSLTAYFWDLLIWVMPPRARAVLLATPASDDPGERMGWAVGRSTVYRLQGDTAGARQYADSALAAFDMAFPSGGGDQPGLRGMRAKLLADAGRSPAALSELVLAARPWAHPDAMFEATNEDMMAGAYLRIGKVDDALNLWEGLLHKAYWLTPAWMRIAPEFAPLRGNPRFERLVSGS